MSSLFKNSCTSPRLHHSTCLVFASVVIIFSSSFLLVNADCARNEYRNASVVEGQPAGVIATRIADTIPGYQIVSEIISDRHLGILTSIYDAYFKNEISDWTVRMIAQVDHDGMARSLNNPTAPVVFNILFSIIDSYHLTLNVTCVHLTLNVIDIDNNVPRFPDTEMPYVVRINEGVVNSREPLPQAVDADEGINSTTNYTLVDGLGIFQLELRYDQRGNISEVLLQNNVSLDADQQISYNLTVIASEGNENPDSDDLYVMIVFVMKVLTFQCHIILYRLRRRAHVILSY